VLTFHALLLPFAAAVLAPSLVRMLGHRAAWLLAVAPAAIFWHFLGEVGVEPYRAGIDWAPSLGLRFSWYVDGLSIAFALMISGIGALIVVYAGGYLKSHPHQGRFLSFILLFMGAMQGLVLADSFLMLFLFWELTSITSFLLIGFDHAREASRRAAIQALVVTGLGGLSLLAGLLLIAVVTGARDLSLLPMLGPMLRDSVFYPAILLLVLGGAFTKSAQFPFHFWLPNAMEAPTPVSAYLHSATMVKAGVYLLMRLNPSLGGTALWETLLPLFGGITLVAGALLAVRQTDLKLMLAYTTVASLGLLVMLTGIGTEAALMAAALYLLAHSAFKGALFMVAGILDHETGTRDVTRLSGLRRLMPVTFAAALLAACSMAGLPLFFGFLAKEEAYVALGFGSASSTLLTLAALAGNSLMGAIALVVALKPFLGPPAETPKSAHEAPAMLWLGPLVLALCGLAAGILALPVHGLFTSPLASAIAGRPLEVTITTVPHVGLALLLSGVTIALAVAGYFRLRDLRSATSRLFGAIGWGPDRGFDQLMRGLLSFSFRVMSIVQNGRLDIYLTVVFAAVALAIWLPLTLRGDLPAWPAGVDLLLHEWVVVAIALVGLVAVVNAVDRLTAIVSLGIQGFAVALLFLLFGAADLAFTQFMIETLAVVILALVMTRLQLAPADHRDTGQKLLDGAIATACGTSFGMLLLAVVQQPFSTHLTDFYNTYARSIAHGRNVVNVIIVDFRGFDTLGEIAVVMIAGLAILALIGIRAGRVKRVDVS